MIRFAIAALALMTAPALAQQNIECVQGNTASWCRNGASNSGRSSGYDVSRSQNDAARRWDNTNRSATDYAKQKTGGGR